MWEINVADQTLTFMYSMCLGGLLCAFYDVFRAARKTGSYSFLLVFFSDIFFWVVSAFATFIFLISRTNGEIRGYVIVAETIGFLIFRISISKLWFYGLVVCFRAIHKIKSMIICACNKFYVKFEKLILKICNIVFNFLKTIKKLLKNAVELLYTNRNN